MAKVCELVNLKFGLMFGDAYLRNQHDFLFERVYPLLGFEDKNGITIKEVVRLRDHLVNLNPDCRIIGLEEYGNSTGGVVEVWESYGDNYQHDWIEQASAKLSPDMRFTVYVVLPESVWKN